MTSILADFDPLTSPAGSTGVAPASGSPSQVAPAPSSSSSGKFDGTLDSLYAARWHSLRASATHSFSLAFLRPKAPIAEHDDDPVHRALREKAEKAAADAAAAAEKAAAEEARQAEARSAAAAGKEDIGADKIKVQLPGPELALGAPATSTPVPPDSELAKKQAALDADHAREVAAANRHAGRATFRYTSSEDSKTVDPPVSRQSEFVGAVELKGNTITLTDVVRTGSKPGAQATKTDVPGTATLSISQDGKKITGKIGNEELEFELFDGSDPNALTSLLGY